MCDFKQENLSNPLKRKGYRYLNRYSKRISNKFANRYIARRQRERKENLQVHRLFRMKSNSETTTSAYQIKVFDLKKKVAAAREFCSCGQGWGLLELLGGVYWNFSL